jgi:uncharacterized protein (DUF169 family)
MKSQILKAMKMKNSPIAIIFTNENPSDALMITKGKHSCMISMYIKASEGKTVAFNRERAGCGGAIAGLCFGNAFDKTPGGIEYFLSKGRGKGYPEGERYIKTPELAKKWIDSLPYIDIPYEFVVLKPLEEVDEKKEKPVLVSFYTDIHRISALTILANYERENTENVIVRFSSACQSIVLLPFTYSKKKPQKAVLGLFDITVRSMIKADHLSFTVPWMMFLEMESNVKDSFLEKKSWKKIIG